LGRRARGLALLGAAGACAGLAASSVNRYTNDVRAQVGRPVTVITAARDLPRGRLITPQVAGATLVARRVPERFAPPQSLRAVSDAIGYRTAAPIRAGDYVGGSSLTSAESGGRRAPAATTSGRLVEISVAGSESLGDTLRPGALVDVLITTDRGVSARTYLALQRAELVAFSPGGSASKASATLRVTLRQAVLLTAAQNFARELRLVPRPAEERGRIGPTAVTSGELAR
jgi:pilus assembly protein CpaB